MEIQQSSLYRTYIQSLGWKVIELEGANIFVRHFPFFGGLAKIQRSTKLPRVTKLIPLLTRHRIRSIAVEPDSSVSQISFQNWCTKLRKHVRLNRTPFLPTKTIFVDLTLPEEAMFKNFSEAKRRAVRRALKHNVIIKQSTNIDDLIRIKNKSAGFFGFITTYGIRNLWRIFAPQHATILLAYSSPNTKLIAGVLLLFWNNTAYYWIAGATKQGKKMFAPTLLVWEALKLSKKHGAKQFDLVGVWDERTPHKFHEWKGFTKFKEGFGGKIVYYSINNLGVEVGEQ